MSIRSPGFASRYWQVPIFFLAAYVSLAGCADISTLDKGDKNNPWLVTINFASATDCEITGVEAESNSCSLPAEDICVDRGKFIQWSTSPARIDFDIFFGPTKDGAIKGNNGKAKDKVNEFAVPGMYKYSVLRRDCDPEQFLLDPRIRVD